MAASKYSCEECDQKLEKFMNYCPSCGEEQSWEDENGNDECYYCGTEVHSTFNFCPCCGEDIEPDGWNDPVNKAKGFKLNHECGSECGGKVQEFMSYCPWCGDEQTWEDKYDDLECKKCDASISKDWEYCPFCGTNTKRKKSLIDIVMGYGNKPGDSVETSSVYTCNNHSSVDGGPYRVNLVSGKIFPKCPGCGIHADWRRGR